LTRSASVDRPTLGSTGQRGTPTSRSTRNTHINRSLLWFRGSVVRKVSSWTTYTPTRSPSSSSPTGWSTWEVKTDQSSWSYTRMVYQHIGHHMSGK
jgi:hypothetical protein